MVVVAVVLFVVAVALGLLLVRTRAQLDELTRQLEEVTRACDAADDLRRTAEADAAAARRERDDALEREKRARREASEVGRRLAEEREARAEAERAQHEADQARIQADQARMEADEARIEADQARIEANHARIEAEKTARRDDGDVTALWQLALAGVRRTWEVSVAPSPGLPSPLDESPDSLRAAIEIEVDAAREEAGASIDLEWSGDAVAPPAVALPALSIAQALVARLSKVSEQAVLRVASEADGVAIEVEATDGDGRSVVPDDVAAEHRVAPGRYELSAS